MQELVREDPRIRAVLLRSNYGQTAAMAAGFDLFRGAYAVTMDGDLQNDPDDIPAMLKHLEENSLDVVCGWRRDRQDRAFSRKLPSRIANWLIQRFTGTSIHDTGCTLKVYRSWVVQKLHLYSDMHRFIPALAAGTGARVGELVVQHHPRLYGSSKYGIGRILRVLTDLLVVRLIVRFSQHPLRYFAFASIPLFIAGGFLAMLGLLKFHPETGITLVDKWENHYMTASIVTMVAAFNLFVLGLLSELSVSVERLLRPPRGTNSMKSAKSSSRRASHERH
jgi:glycosyltransferase involved in cell wall biosynthesis